MKHSNFTEHVFHSAGFDFNELALEIFQFQYRNNAVYRKFTNLLHIDPAKINSLHQIPFLPVELFKTHTITCFEQQCEAVFESSSTTGKGLSRHFIPYLNNYRLSIIKTFEERFGPVSDYIFIGMLPGYLERKNASLVFMVKTLMEASKKPENGFYSHQSDAIISILNQINTANSKAILFGVTWALLDFAKQYPMPLQNHITIIETGGMKGRKKEIIRTELHAMLHDAFTTRNIVSEYGMTELQGMSYTNMQGVFTENERFKVLIKDPSDPLTEMPEGATGNICIMDLANWNTCSFLSTADLGRRTGAESFEVLGRTDNSDIRGCSLMAV